MAITRVAAGNNASIDDLNQLIDLLEGTSSSYTLAFLLRCLTGSDFTIRLADAAGARSFIIQDSAASQVASIDSDGNLMISGLFTPGTLKIPVGTTPSQTTEGYAVWDSDDDRLTIGTGAATKVIGLSRGAGSDASATQELMYDTTNTALKVWDGSASKTVGGRADDMARQAFRDSRRLVAEYTAQDNDTLGTSSNVGLGFFQVVTDTGDKVSTLSGEPYFILGAGASGTVGVFGAFTNTSNGLAVLAPNKSPRWLGRIKLPAASANVTAFLAGFFASAGGATANGAYLRVVTTGNTYFVTRQGGSETATDLGALSRTTILGFEIETADAGVTWVCRNQAGTVLATHTTNVPAAATALVYGVHYIWATATIPIGVAYQRVDGTFA